MEDNDNNFEGYLFPLIYLSVILFIGYLMCKYGSGSAFDGWVPDYP